MKRTFTIGLLALAGLMAACGGSPEVEDEIGTARAIENTTTTVLSPAEDETMFLLNLMADTQKALEINTEIGTLATAVAEEYDFATYVVEVPSLVSDLEVIVDKWERADVPARFQPAVDKWVEGMGMLVKGYRLSVEAIPTLDESMIDLATTYVGDGTALISEATELMEAQA